MQDPEERGLYIAFLILFPLSVLEWLYFTWLIWPYLVSKRLNMGRFRFMVKTAYASATIAAFFTRPVELTMLSGHHGEDADGDEDVDEHWERVGTSRHVQRRKGRRCLELGGVKVVCV